MSTAADGDVSGVQFSFAVERGRLRGWVRDAAGEVPPERSLDTVRVTGHGDSLYFSYRGDTGEEYSYRVHATCQGLQGTARLFQTGSSPGVLKEFVVRRAKWIAKP